MTITSHIFDVIKDNEHCERCGVTDAEAKRNPHCKGKPDTKRPNPKRIPEPETETRLERVVRYWLNNKGAAHR